MKFDASKYRQNIKRQLTDTKTPSRFIRGYLVAMPVGFLINDFTDSYAATGHINASATFHRYLMDLPARLIILAILSIAFWWILTLVVRYYIRSLPAPVQISVPHEPGVWPPAPSDPQTGEPLPPPTGRTVPYKETDSVQ